MNNKINPTSKVVSYTFRIAIFLGVGCMNWWSKISFVLHKLEKTPQNLINKKGTVEVAEYMRKGWYTEQNPASLFYP
jgi:hypothetical protein